MSTILIALCGIFLAVGYAMTTKPVRKHFESPAHLYQWGINLIFMANGIALAWFLTETWG